MAERQSNFESKQFAVSQADAPMKPASSKRAREEQFNQRYMGLTRAEVALREKMAQKFGRKAGHLDATSTS